MFIIQLKQPKTGKVHLLHWSLDTNSPAEGARLLPPAAFEQWVKENHAKVLPELPTLLGNIKHHGTSHPNPIVTPERWLERSRYGTPPAPYTVEQLFELYGEEEAEPVKKKASAKKGKEGEPQG